MRETRVPYGYLPIQLAPERPIHQRIMEEWKAELTRGQFTLGPAVERLEAEWAKVCGVKHAIGVNSGTDALIIAMKALGIEVGDEVITCPNTFVATIGAIVAVGAKPVFVDAGSDYLMDSSLVAYAIGSGIYHRLKAILPVDLTGSPWHQYPDSNAVPFIRDACQSIGATINGVSSGKFAAMSAYSLHPLKNVHACGDGGIIVTDNDALAKWIRLYRNHGLKDRDTVEIPGINSRLDTLQAIAAWHMLQGLEQITAARVAHAALYDELLEAIEGVTIPPRLGSHIRQVFHTYVVQVDRRAELVQYLAEQGVETKIHYPIPVHLQPGYAFLGYKRGDFPVVEHQAEHILTLPVNEYLTVEQIGYVAERIRDFYARER